MKTFIKYPKTPQFRDVVRDVKHLERYEGRDEYGKPVYNQNRLPKVRFKGTVKAHGTNAGIIYSKTDGLYFQSRNKVITPEKDNVGFATFMSENKGLQHVLDSYKCKESVHLFGEWCGSSIQKGVALSELKDKIFIVFQVVVDGEDTHAFSTDHKHNIYSVDDFKTYSVEIDFESPGLSQNEIIKQTSEVENYCPIGMNFGIEGIGEGIVYEANYKGVRLFFKSKGEKHSISKVSKIAQVDIEKLEGVESFVRYACTENRMKQALENVELDIKNLGAYLKWIFKDIQEEESDVLEGNGLTFKEVSPGIAKKSKEFFFNKL